MSGQNHDWLEPELQMAGQSVARLRRSKVPAGLIERTLERAAQIKPLRKKLLLLRPITHPVARIAAVAMLMSMVMTVPLADLDTVDSVGRRIEYNVVGTKNVDRFENLMDGLLAKINTQGYSQNELDAVTGAYATPLCAKSKPVKLRLHSGV